MRQNDSIKLFARRMTGRLVLLTVVVIIALATSRRALAAGPQTEQCSLAVMTRQRLGAGTRVCDVPTVRSLAKHGHVFEQNQMGMVSMLALRPGYDAAEAVKWFEQAAVRGYAPAQVNLAVMYINGWGVKQNYGAALQWMNQAAKQKYARAYYNLGILYQQGNGVRQDNAEALRFFRLGAEGGDSSAQTNLGYMYDKGLGVERDLSIAVRWYRTAANKSNALAQNNLADMYLRGEGVPQDDAEAFQLSQRAATQGQTGARIKLAYMYSSGRGVERDLATAYSWVAAADAAGDRRGDDLMRNLESQLTKVQIAQGKERAAKLNAEGEGEVMARALEP